ncbi:MAG: hypothetical protein KJO55_08355 [Gammaproteobacteria bacterium]|nr:hypothetical protein [Gammaproteobacteria bacterium]NND59860.1 hypothetical protein [Gammaproteobacteria bacterium]
MKRVTIIFALAALGLAGCATEPAVAPAPEEVAVAATEGETGSADAVDRSKIESTADSDDKVICRQITPTGSHRKKMVCRKLGDIKRERRSAQDALGKTKGATIQAPGDT